MDLEAKVVGLVVIIVLVAMAVAFAHRYSRRPATEFPPMGKLNVPCDPDLHADFLNALKREKIRFIPPVQPAEFNVNPYSSTQMPVCFVLVAEKDYGRAEQLRSQFLEKWYL